MRARSGVSLRRFVALGSVVALTACSESITIFAANPCPTPVVVSFDDGDVVERTEVAPNTTVEAWSICCEPGKDGVVLVAAGDWTTMVDYDTLRDQPVIDLPPAACNR